MIQLDDDGIDGQDHEGQIVIHHAQHHSPLGIHHGEILQVGAEDVIIEADEADLLEQLVQKAVVFQNGHPRIGPQQEVHPHGQHNEHHGQPLEPGALLAHEIGHRVADQQTDHRGDDGQLEGPEEHLRIAPHLHEVIQRKAAVGGGKGIGHHNDNGGHHEDRHPHLVGYGEPGELILHPRSPPRPSPERRPPTPHTPRSRSCNLRTGRSIRSFS